MFLVQLKKAERQRRAGPRIVAPQTFGAAVKTPRLSAMAAGSLRVGNFKSAVRARRVHERGVALLVVPLIAVPTPVDSVEVQDLSFDPAPALRFPRFNFE